MSRRKCAGCGCNLYPDDSIDYVTFALCLDCDAELLDDEEEAWEDERWAAINTDDREEWE